jgi:hypothetical protein
MRGMIDRYLDRVMAVADISDPARESQIRQELRDHLEQKVSALQTQGYDPAEALVKAVEDHGNPILIGYRLRPWKFLDVRLRGTARGVIAIGPKAHGIVAIGGMAVGIFAFGGLSVGLVSFGGLALGLLLAWGGVALGTFVYGGLALGVVAFGGMAVGVIASGGGAAGIWVPGAGGTLWSHYNWQTVPTWWKGIGHWLSYDGRSRKETQAFYSFAGILNLIMIATLFLGSGLQMWFTMKEAKRIKSIDGLACE